MRIRALPRPLVLALAAALSGPGALAPRALAHDDDQGPLHFSHPLVAESPSPDTKIRVDHFFANEPGEDAAPGADRHGARLEGEYAFGPGFSLELDIPVTLLDVQGSPAASALDTVSIGLKYANFTFAGHGLLLGGGLELGLPTGNERKGIGSDHIVEIEAFVDFGYSRGRFETVGFLSLGLPVNDIPADGAADRERGWNLATLFHATPGLELLVEFDGTHVSGGEEDGLDAINITPGFKIKPWRSIDLSIGAGVSIPISRRKEFDLRSVFSVFCHF